MAASIGCVGTAGGRGGVEALAVREVEWNPGHVDVGRVTAVADAGQDVLVVGDQGAFFLTNGSVTGSDRRSFSWRGAAVIPSAEGKGEWLSATDRNGVLFRVRARTGLADISDRYGLSGTPVLGAAALDNGLLGLVLAHGRLAVADGRNVTTFERDGVNPGQPLAGGGGKAAWIEEDGVRVLDPVKRENRLFALPGVKRAALDDRGRLVAITNHALYAEDATGTLALLHETASPRVTLSGLAVSGQRVWFSEGANLGLLERPPSAPRLAITIHLAGPTKSALTGSPSGDVWSLIDGRLTRFTTSATHAADRSPARFRELLAPVLARACASCHGPNGPTGIDLTTFEAWQSRRPSLRYRVLESRDMPPRDHPIGESDRELIRAWISDEK